MMLPAGRTHGHQQKPEGNSMVERKTNRTRRRLVRIAAAGFATAVCPPMSRALAAEKMTQRQAEYQSTPNGIYSCGQCSLFVPPSFCKVVEGEVSTDGWCKAFVLAD
jgi:hypothetical protein